MVFITNHRQEVTLPYRAWILMAMAFPGITSTWTTGAVATGTLKVTLRHYGGNPPGKAIGDDVNSPKSSTDIEVTFNF